MSILFSLFLPCLLSVSGAGPPITAAEQVQPATIGLSANLGPGGSATVVYVALVAEDSPWSEPLHEEFIPSSSSVEWRVPPGRYRFVVGAPGYRVVYGEVIRAVSGESVGKRQRLVALAPLRGRVRTVTGEPIAGARVGHPRAFVAEFANRLSAMGKAHLAANFVTTTNAEGQFSLPALAGFRHLVLVEAEGYAPGFLADVLFDPPNSDGPWEISLLAGAALELALKGGPVAPEGRIWLHPAGRHPLRTTGIEPPGALWERRLHGGLLRWPALPAGRYEIWLRDGQGIGSSPQRLALVHLKAGETKRVEAELPMAAKGVTPKSADQRVDEPAESPVRILARELRGSSKDGDSLKRWRAGRWTDLSAKRKLVSGGAIFTVQAACRPGDRYLFAGPTSIGATTLVVNCDDELTLEVWPRSDVAGSVKLHRQPDTAVSSLLLFRPCDPTTEAGIVEIPVVLDRIASFQTAAPAGCFDIFAHLSGLAPARWRRVLLKPGKQEQLEARAVAPGGALLARVVAAETGEPQADVKVGLLGVEELSSAVAAAVAGHRFKPLTSSLTDQDGWFRIAGLAPADYILRLDSGRRWPHFTKPVGIRAGEEYFQPELELPRPVKVTVEIVASEDFFAEAQELTIALEQDQEDAPAFFLRSTVKETRQVEFVDVPPGLWRFTVAARLNHGGTQTVLDSHQELVADQDAIIRLDVEASLFRGVVLRAGKPEKGMLRLSRLPFGVAGGQRVSAPTDDEGKFQLFLRRAGNYAATFTSLASGGEQTLVPKVVFENPHVEVEIDLSGGRISGQVLAPNGEAVEGASIRASALGDPTEAGGLQILNQRTRSVADGRFVLSGLPAATWSVTARSGELASDPRPIQLLAEEQVDGVLVELRESDWIEVTVIDEQGRPLSGVQVEYFVTAESSGSATTTDTIDDRGRSGSNGTLQLDVRGHTGELATFRLKSPGGAITALRHRLEPTTTLVVPARTGRVDFTFEEATETHEVATLALVREDGAFLDLLAISKPDEKGDGRMIPHLSAGNWRLVRWRTIQDYFALLSGGGSRLLTEAQWTLESGGTAEIVIPKTKTAKE